MNNTNVLFIQKLPGVNVRDQEFHVKSIWLCRASKSEMSNWRKVFSIHNSEDMRRMNNKTFFFIEKSPSVNVREQKFHVKSIWSSRQNSSKIRSVKLETSFYNSKSFREKNNKMFSSSKRYQALTYETKSFHVKSTRSSREDFSKNQNSQNGNKFFITQKRLSEKNK